MFMEKSPQALRSEALAKLAVKNLNKRNFAAFYCEDRQSALAKALELTGSNDAVSWGDSVTLEVIGLLDVLRRRYNYIDRDSSEVWEERLQLMQRGMLCDTFFLSANAISAEGILVNIDRTGNRTASMAFGPKQVVVIAGVNKLTATYGEAIARARNFAAALNIQRTRFNGLKTPCKENGMCVNCICEDCLCNFIMTVRHGNTMIDGTPRIKVILVGENLGY